MDLFCILGRGAIVFDSPESRKVRKSCFCPNGQTTAIGEVLEKEVWFLYEALGVRAAPGMTKEPSALATVEQLP